MEQSSTVEEAELNPDENAGAVRSSNGIGSEKQFPTVQQVRESDSRKVGI